MSVPSVFFIFSFFLLSSLSASAFEITREICRDVDFSDKFGPPRDQGASGICYAEAAADLIAFNQGISPVDRVSALDVAFNLKTVDPEKMLTLMPSSDSWIKARNIGTKNVPILIEHQKTITSQFASQLLDTGDIELAIDAYNFRGGACLERQLPSQGPSVSVMKDYFLSFQIFKLSNPAVSQNFLGLGYGMGGGISSPVSSDSFRKGMPVFCDSNRDPLAPAQTLMQETNRTMIKSMGKSIDAACAKRTPLSSLKTSVMPGSRTSEGPTALFVAAALHEGVPVGIGYDPTFLAGGPGVPQGRPIHASVVVGSRWNSETGTCEFKIRNSYGTDCERYHPEYRKNCAGGNIWVSADDINVRVDSVVAIVPQK